MTQQEFESLYGKKVIEVEFNLINCIYMLYDNETKQDFVARFKKMSKEELLADVAAILEARQQIIDHFKKEKEDAVARAMEAERRASKVSDKDLEELREWHQREKELEGTIDGLNHMLADAEQNHHDFVSVVAVSAHNYDTDAINKACAKEMGVKQYYRTLQAADCTPTKTDLNIFVETLN